MSKVHATFIGGPLDGRHLEVEDLRTYAAADPRNADQQVWYRKILYVRAGDPATQHVFYAIDSLTDEKAQQQALELFATRKPG